LPPVINYDIARAHEEFKEIIDSLKEQRISRDDIADRLKEENKPLNKSTITRYYNDLPEGKPHNLKLLLRYTSWIKQSFQSELGLIVDEPAGEYETLKQKLDEVLKELKSLRRGLFLRQRRGRDRRN
jgi:hypothetical protein